MTFNLSNIPIPAFLEQTYFNNTLIDYLIFFGIIAIGVFLAKIIYWAIQKFVKVFTSKTKTRLDDLLIDMLEEPIVILIVLFSINIGWTFLTFPETGGGILTSIPTWFDNIMYMAYVFSLAWLVSRIIDSLIEEYLKPLASKSDTDLDDHLLPILQTVVSVITFAVAIIMILDHFGQQIGPLLAGLGIGGLAFAFAAKDIIANVFGSITIIFDKPFKLGDRINISGQDGFVREINLRRTKVEKLDGRMLYVPNSKFTEEVLENVTQEWARKVSMKIGLVYDTDAKGMKKAKSIVENIIAKTEGIHKEKKLISFTDFGDFSRQILVIYWIIDKERIFDIMDEFNMELMTQLEKEGLEMAFPTQTIELKK